MCVKDFSKNTTWDIFGVQKRLFNCTFTVYSSETVFSQRLFKVYIGGIGGGGCGGFLKVAKDQIWPVVVPHLFISSIRQ